MNIEEDSGVHYSNYDLESIFSCIEKTYINNTSLISMDLVKLLEYTIWAEERYIQYCQELVIEDFDDPVANHTKSVKEIMFHTLETYWYWHQFLLDQNFENAPKIKNYDRELIISEIRKFHNIIMEFAKTKDLNQTFVEQWEDDKPVTTTAENIIFNYVTHSAYHRGQLALLLRQLGYEKIEETDFNPYIYHLGQL